MEEKTRGSDMAFPIEDHGAVGLTKREWFAGMAMMGLSTGDNTIKKDVVSAVKAADLLIDELNKD